MLSHFSAGIRICFRPTPTKTSYSCLRNKYFSSGDRRVIMARAGRLATRKRIYERATGARPTTEMKEIKSDAWL